VRSAGANLAASVSIHTAGGAKPRFTLLFYPGTDVTARYPSRDLFAHDFFLTDHDLNWFIDHYLTDAQRSDPRVSVMLSTDLSGFPATYMATAGFDPLRDEGEAFAHRLAQAGGTPLAEATTISKLACCRGRSPLQHVRPARRGLRSSTSLRGGTGEGAAIIPIRMRGAATEHADQHLTVGGGSSQLKGRAVAGP
jgi:hypothetical protein